MKDYLSLESFWIDKLTDDIESFHFIKNTINNDLNERLSYCAEIQNDITKKIKDVTGNSDFSLFVLASTILSILIYKYSLIHKFCLTTFENNNKTDDEPIFLINSISEKETVRELLYRIKDDLLSSSGNSIPFSENIIEKIHIRKGIHPSRLFNTGFAYKAIHNIKKIFERFDYFFFLDQNSMGSLSFKCYFNSCEKRFNYVSDFAGNFVHLLNSIDSLIDEKICDVELLTCPFYDKKGICDDGDLFIPVHKLFEIQSEKHPDKVALVEGEFHITYSHLNVLSGKVASELNSKGVNSNSLIGVHLDNSNELIISILGILKSGAAYIPIDTNLPLKRIEYIIKDSNINILLTNNIFKGANILCLSPLKVFLTCEKNFRQIHKSKPSDYAYVIYTSGSTGNPKGVLITHQGLFNYINWAKKQYLNNNSGNFPLFTSVSFDLTITSIFLPLCSSGQIITYKNSHDDFVLNRIFEDCRLNVVKLTPSHLKALCNFQKSNFSKGKRIKTTISAMILGGEELDSLLCRDFLSLIQDDRNVSIYNEYGPTESVVGSMIYKFDLTKDLKQRTVPIGRAIENMAINIYSGNNLASYGVPGEIYLTSESISKGYLNNPELTIEKFNGYTYKTGDLAYINKDDELEFIGRIDNQVKVRGHRIEIKEIEYYILKFSGVKDTAVYAGELNGLGRIIAFVAFSNGYDMRIELKAHLSELLPEYMVPDLFITVGKIPVNINGKVDYKKLLEQVRFSKSESYVGAENRLEEELVEIWSEILKINKSDISTTESFFSIGGNSILVISLVASIFRNFSVEISIKKIFELKTIKELSKEIQNQNVKKYIKIQPAEKKEYYPLSSAQSRLFFIQMTDKSNTAYNMTSKFRIEGILNYQSFEAAFTNLIQRHEALRTSFRYVNYKPFQFIHDEVSFHIEVIDLHDGDIFEAAKEFECPFDLSIPPLLRAKILKKSETEHYLLLDLHHIISDALSNSIIVNEIINFLNKKSLKPLNFQFKDYADWQTFYRKSEKYNELKKFWSLELSEFKNFELIDGFQSDYHDYQGGSMTFHLDKELTTRINEFVLNTGCTSNIFLFSVVAVFLNKLTFINDLVMGLPVTGRRHSELEGTVGMFINILPVRFELADDDSFNHFLMKIKEKIIMAIEHQDYQFDDIVSNILAHQGTSRNNFIRLAFQFEESQLNFSNDKIAYQILDMIISPVISEIDKTNFDILITTFVSEGKIVFRIDYSKLLFSKEMISGFAEDIKDLTKKIIDHPQIILSDISIKSMKKENADNIFQNNSDFAF